MADLDIKSCNCCDVPQVEARFEVFAGEANCCGLPAPISGYPDSLFSAFSYDTTYTVRTYSVPDFPNFTESPCVRTRSRTGADYSYRTEEGPPSCPDSEFTDEGCEDVYDSLPSCGSVSPSPGLQCISLIEDNEITSTLVDCSVEAVTEQAALSAFSQGPFSEWEDVRDIMPGKTSDYAGTLYSRTEFEIRKVGYPVPIWIVLTIEEDNGVDDPSYVEEEIFLGWGITAGLYTLTPVYGLARTIVSLKLFVAPQYPPSAAPPPP